MLCFDTGNIKDGGKTPQQRALEELQRFRKRSNVEIDYKAELAKARNMRILIDTNLHFTSVYGERRTQRCIKGYLQNLKVEGIDSFKIRSALDNEVFHDFEDCL